MLNVVLILVGPVLSTTHTAGVKRNNFEDDVSTPSLDLNATPHRALETLTLSQLGFQHALDLSLDQLVPFKGHGAFNSRSATLSSDNGKPIIMVDRTHALLDVSKASALVSDLLMDLGVANPHKVYKATAEGLMFGGMLNLDGINCGLASFATGNRYTSKKNAKAMTYMTACLAWYLIGPVDEEWRPNSSSDQQALSKRARRRAREIDQETGDAPPARSVPPEKSEPVKDSAKRGDMDVGKFIERINGLVIPEGDVVAESLTSADRSDRMESEDSHMTTELPTQITSSTGSMYKSSSEFWSKCIPPRPGGYSVSILTITAPDGQERYRPLALLTQWRLPVPEEGGFDLFDYSNNPLKATLTYGSALHLDAENLGRVYHYTKTLMRMAVNKPLEMPFFECPYFILPLKSHKEAVINWQEVDKALETESRRIDLFQDLNSQIEDAVIAIPDSEISKRYYIKKIRTDITFDTPPEAVGLSRVVDGKKFNTLFEMQSAKRHHFPGDAPLMEDIKFPDQPVFELRRLPPIFNMCRNESIHHAPFDEETEYRWPEVISYRSIPQSVYISAQTLPTIMILLDDLLLAKEVNERYLGGKARDSDVLAAITAPSASRPYDYQRLEFVGDSFLRFGIGAYFYCADEHMSSTQLTQATRGITDNKPLRDCMLKSRVIEYVRRQIIVPLQYSPVEHIGIIPGRGGIKAHRSKAVTPLGLKPIADVNEALIGAGCLASGPGSVIEISRALGAELPSPLTWSDFRHMPVPKLASEAPHLSHEAFETITAKVGYRFKSRELLSFALSSVRIDRVQYDRLTFLGSGAFKYYLALDLYASDRNLNPLAFTLWKSLLSAPDGLAAVMALNDFDQHVSPDWDAAARSEHKLYMRHLQAARDADDGSIRMSWSELKAVKVSVYHFLRQR